MPNDLPPTGEVALSYAEEATFMGTYRGIPGTYTCKTNQGCSISMDDKGKVVIRGDDEFTFVPTNQVATYDDPDAAYAYFGWWLNKPAKAGDPHMVEVFSGGTNMHAADVNNAIEGTATYAGPAAGKYVTRTFQAGVHSDSGVGHFTAKANLTAKFGEDNEAGTIGGSVTGFVLDDTTAASWKVTLEDAMLNDNTATFSGMSEVDFGGGATDGDTPAGAWQGSFYDDGATDADAPSTVAGTFDAVTVNASVIGGFGATKQ